MTEDKKSLTKVEILRKQTFYQKSFTGETPTATRCSSPLVKGRATGDPNRQVEKGLNYGILFPPLTFRPTRNTKSRN